MSFDTHPPRALALRAGAFANKTWRAPSDLRFVHSLSEVEIGANEAGRVGRSYGWYFRQDETGWALVVGLTDALRQRMCRLTRAESALGLPFLLRMYPFTFVRQGGRRCLAVWDTGVGQATEKGQRFFEGERLAAPVAQVSAHFQSFAADLALAARLAGALAAAGLLVPAASGGFGYYEVNEAKLMSLPEPTIIDLHKTGALGLAYAQLFSSHSQALARSQEAQAAPSGRGLQSDGFLDSIARDLETDIPALDIGFEG